MTSPTNPRLTLEQRPNLQSQRTQSPVLFMETKQIPNHGCNSYFMFLFKLQLSRRNTCYDINTPSYVLIITQGGRVSFFLYTVQTTISFFHSHRLRLPMSPDLLDYTLSGTGKKAESAKVWMAHENGPQWSIKTVRRPVEHNLAITTAIP
jgi:hypothetical protein